MMFSFSGSKIRKGILSIGVLSQLLECPYLYLFKPRAERQCQAHFDVRGLQRQHFSFPPQNSSFRPEGRRFCRPGVEVRFSIARFLCYESLFDFKFQASWILLPSVSSALRMIFTSQFAPNLAGPRVPAAASALPASCPGSRPVGHSLPCTSARILYVCRTPGAAARPYIP